MPGRRRGNWLLPIYKLITVKGIDMIYRTSAHHKYRLVLGTKWGMRLHTQRKKRVLPVITPIGRLPSWSAIIDLLSWDLVILSLTVFINHVSFSLANSYRSISFPSAVRIIRIWREYCRLRSEVINIYIEITFTAEWANEWMSLSSLHGNSIEFPCQDIGSSVESCTSISLSLPSFLLHLSHLLHNNTC